jgi:hypothetical protein
LCFRFGPSGLELLAVFERQPILVGGGDDSLLAAMAVDEMAEQLAELFHFKAEFLELGGLRATDGLAAFQVVRDFAGIDHVAYHSETGNSAPEAMRNNSQDSWNYFSRATTGRSSRTTLFQRRMGCPVERVSPPTFHARQFDPREQQRQIGRVHFDMCGTWQREWPLEGPALQSLHPNGQAVAIPIHQLESISSAIEKQKQIAQADVALELGLDDGVQAIEALAHVDVLGIEVDSRLARAAWEATKTASIHSPP